MKKIQDIQDLVGDTPLIRLKGPSEETGCEIFGKAEFFNPGQSIKDRAALHIIKDAERNGLLKKGGTIVEGTAGNTGIGLSIIGNALGYKTVIVIPETQTQEKTTEINLAKILNEISDSFKSTNLNILLENDKIILKGRPISLRRSFENIIQNGLIYGKKVQVKVQKSSNRLLIFFDDDGPGIPESEYENVFKPFYKIDKGRADSKSSVGLGLSIASDIIRSHGGNIKLNKSSFNGLEVKIFLPV